LGGGEGFSEVLRVNRECFVLRRVSEKVFEHGMPEVLMSEF